MKDEKTMLWARFVPGKFESVETFPRGKFVAVERARRGDSGQTGELRHYLVDRRALRRSCVDESGERERCHNKMKKISSHGRGDSGRRAYHARAARVRAHACNPRVIWEEVLGQASWEGGDASWMDSWTLGHTSCDEGDFSWINSWS